MKVILKENLTRASTGGTGALALLWRAAVLVFLLSPGWVQAQAGAGGGSTFWGEPLNIQPRLILILQAVEGRCTVGDSAVRPEQIGKALPFGFLRCSAGGAIEVSAGEGILLRLSGPFLLALEVLEEQPGLSTLRLRLYVGQVEALLSRALDPTWFRVDSGSERLAPRGTHFVVTATGVIAEERQTDSQLLVQVLEGRVGYENRLTGQVQEIPAGLSLWRAGDLPPVVKALTERVNVSLLELPRFNPREESLRPALLGPQADTAPEQAPDEPDADSNDGATGEAGGRTDRARPGAPAVRPKASPDSNKVRRSARGKGEMPAAGMSPGLPGGAQMTGDFGTYLEFQY